MKAPLSSSSPSSSLHPLVGLSYTGLFLSPTPPHQLNHGKVHYSPHMTASASLSFDNKSSHKESLSNENVLKLDDFSALSLANPKLNDNGTLIDHHSYLNNPEINPNCTLINSQLISTEASTFPAILPPSQLSLAELLRQNFDGTVSLPAAICNAADTLITSLLSPAQLQPSVDPHFQLAGNCAPVSETPPTPCVIKGTLPSDLKGAYLRNGPNATRLHRGEGYHLFDGDGMLHAVKFDDGNATFCARYVKTIRFCQEEEAGRPLFPKFFGGLSGMSGVARIAVTLLRASLGLIDMSKGWGLSNTSVGFFNGQILSLSEDDMPYVIKVMESGDLITVGPFKLPGKSNMCAHPKFDGSTGEMFAFSFNPPSVPIFSFFRVSADGIKSPDIPIFPLRDVPLMHDFAMTRRYVVFPDNQLVMRPIEALKGGSAIVVDSEKIPRFCLMPRYVVPEEAAQKAQWFEAPGCNCFHYINAWEEGPDEVVVITPVLTPPECMLEIPAVNTTCTLSEIRLNTATGKAARRAICIGNFEFGTLNQKYVGRKSRYVYLASGCYPQLTGVVKVDLESSTEGGDAVVGQRVYGEGCSGSEPFFVPRQTKNKGEQLIEDDGYILCYVHDEGRGVSELLVMDARSPSLDVIACVQLPSRVPCGFHGWYVSQQQLAKQA